MSEEQALTEEKLKALQEEAKKLEEGTTPLGAAPEDVFAGMWQIFWPRFSLIYNKLSKKQQKRLTKALMEYPLNEKEYKTWNKLHQEAFQLGSRLLMAKTAMLMHEIGQQMKTEQAVSDKVEEPSSLNEEGKKIDG